jgi:hypothetical protein
VASGSEGFCKLLPDTCFPSLRLRLPSPVVSVCSDSRRIRLLYSVLSILSPPVMTLIRENPKLIIPERSEQMY